MPKSKKTARKSKENKTIPTKTIQDIISENDEKKCSIYCEEMVSQTLDGILKSGYKLMEEGDIDRNKTKKSTRSLGIIVPDSQTQALRKDLMKCAEDIFDLTDTSFRNDVNLVVDNMVQHSSALGMNSMLQFKEKTDKSCSYWNLVRQFFETKTCERKDDIHEVNVCELQCKIIMSMPKSSRPPTTENIQKLLQLTYEKAKRCVHELETRRSVELERKKHQQRDEEVKLQSSMYYNDNVSEHIPSDESVELQEQDEPRLSIYTDAEKAMYHILISDGSYHSVMECVKYIFLLYKEDHPGFLVWIEEDFPSRILACFSSMRNIGHLTSFIMKLRNGLEESALRVIGEYFSFDFPNNSRLYAYAPLEMIQLFPVTVWTKIISYYMQSLRIRPGLSVEDYLVDTNKDLSLFYLHNIMEENPMVSESEILVALKDVNLSHAVDIAKKYGL